MGEAARLYEQDYLAWTREQVKALRDMARTGSNAPLDYEHLAEEIDDLGKSERHELDSRIATILEPLLKLQHAPASMPRRGWRTPIQRSRDSVADRLERSPSLRRDLPAALSTGLKRAARIVLLDLEDRGELTPDLRNAIVGTTYTEDQLLGDWFPPPPAA